MGGNAVNWNAGNYINKLIEEFGAELEPIVKQTYNSTVSELEKKASIKKFIPLVAYNHARNILYEKYKSLKNRNVQNQIPENANANPPLSDASKNEEKWFVKYNPFSVLKNYLIGSE